MTRPRFHPRFTVYLHDDTLILISEQRSHLLQGAAYARVAPLLTGFLTVDEITERVRPHISPIDLVTVLAHLRRSGFVVDADADLVPEASLPEPVGEEGTADDDFRHRAGVDRELALPRIRSTPVTLRTFGEIARADYEQAFAKQGLVVSDDSPLCVALVDDYLRSDLAAFNQRALASGSPWLLAKPVGETLWLGPLFVPGSTACWTCLADRLRPNRDIERFFEKLPKARLQQAVARTPDIGRARVAEIVARNVARWIGSGAHPDLEGRIVTTDDGVREESHVLVRRPQCPVCGSSVHGARDAARVPVTITSTRKLFVADGGHRTCLPEETVQRYAHLISPITGVVSHITRVTTKDDPFAIYVGGRDRRRPSRTLAELLAAVRSASGGKGRTDAQARASALCEAIERTSGSFDGTEPTVRARLADVEHAVEPNALMLFSEAQCAARDEWNARGNARLSVPEPYDADVAIEWAPAWSLTHGRITHLPAGCCYFGHPDTRFCRVTSNGHAAGNTIEEAILQGFMELVERDSVAIWWYNRLKRPEVDLDSFDDPFLCQVLQHNAAAGRRLWVLDLTFDFGIPAFASVSAWIDREPDEVMLGFGAHFDARLAIGRAITEAAQMPAPGLRTEAGWRQLDDYRREWFRLRIADNPHLLPNGEMRTMEDYPRTWSDDLADDVKRCVELAAARGLETIVLDQTRPDVGMPVVKVVVPGLRPHFPRFAPGRLYDVPVATGLLDQPTSESDLNPMPLLM